MIAAHARSAWRYRHFILSSIRGELKSRFSRSKIGGLWHVLHPLALATIYALVLSKVLGAKLGGVDNEAAYAIYLMSGIACWSFFSEIANRSMTIFIDYGAAMKKIAFPRIALPLIVLGGAMVNQALLLVAIAVVFAFFGHYPGVEWLGVLVGAFAAGLFGFGVGMLCGVFNVFLRDTGQVMSVVFQVWFWMTPIVYTREALNDGIGAVIARNPMTPIVGVYQDALLRHQWPDLASLAAPFTLAAALAIAAMIVFRRASPELVDAL